MPSARLLLLGLSAPHLLCGGEFTFTIGDDAGLAHVGEYVLVSLPFARGVFKETGSIAVVDEEGRAVPVQCRELCRWRDGTLRWVQAALATDVEQGGRREYRVVLDPGAERPAVDEPVAAREAEDEVSVDTGTLRLSLPRRDAGLWRFALGEAALAFPATVVATDSGVHTSTGAPIDELTVEADGPLAAAVRLAGWLVGPQGEKHYRYQCRLFLYAASARVRMLHTVIVAGGPNLHRVKKIALVFPCRNVRRAEIVGPVDGQPIASTPPLRLSSLSHRGYEIRGTGDKALQTGERALGGMAWDDGTTRAALLTRNFWQQGPKGIRIDPDGAQLLLLDAEDEPLEIGKTRAKSHDLLLCLSTAAGPARPPLALAKLWQTPLLPIVDPVYLCQTEALTVLSPVDKEFFPAFEAAVENTMGRWVEEIDRDVNYLGLMDYGDGPLPPGAYGHKGVAYVDQEYDTSHALLQLFARSGDRRFFDLAEAAARHFMDVDVDQLAGWNRFHGYRDTCETHKAVTTGLEWGHVHLDGLVDFYYLTGDRRALEIAKGIGNCCLPLGQGLDHGRRRSLFKGCERSLGWPLLSLMRIYEATLDKKYLEAADNIVAYVNLYARSPQDEFQRGAWWRTWMADGCKPFMCGILHEGLDKHHELTGAPETEASILRGLDWLIEHMWNPESEAFMYEFNAFNPGHRDKYPASLNLLVAHAFGYGYRVSGRPQYLDVGLRALRSASETLANGTKYCKDFGIAFRSTPQVVGHLYKAKGSFRFPGEPAPAHEETELIPTRYFPWRAASTTDVTLLPGSTITAQSGDLDVRDRPAAYHGKVLTSWEEEGSWAEWAFEIATSGTYSMLVRYATGAKTCVRQALLDGRELGAVRFPSTGGFGQTRKELNSCVAAGPDGQPLLPRLTPGKHTLRLAHEAGGIALDCVAFVLVPAGKTIRLENGQRPKLPAAKLVAHFPFDQGLAPLRGHAYGDPDAQASEMGDSLTDQYLDPADKTGYESGLNFGAFGGAPRGICQYLEVAEPRSLEALQFRISHRDQALPHYTVYLVQVEDTSVEAMASAEVLCSWPALTAGATGIRTLRTSEAAPKTKALELAPDTTYAAIFVYDPEGNRQPHKCETHATAGISLKADRDANPRPMLRWFSNGRWGQYNWVVWLAALPRLGPAPDTESSVQLVPGTSGTGVFLNSKLYLSGDVPSGFLSKPGSVSLMVKPAWQVDPHSVNKRCLLHVQGESWFAPALSIVTIYGDLRVRLYDDRGHLCGALEAGIGHWKKDEWHSVVLSWAEGYLALALDGRRAASTERVALPRGSVKELYFGWRPGNWFLNATIDEAKIWRGVVVTREEG